MKLFVTVLISLILSTPGLALAVTEIRGVLNAQAVETLWQDPKDPVVIAYANKVHKFSTLAIAGSINDTTIDVTDATTCAAGDSIRILSPSDSRFYGGTQVGALVGNVITLDNPLDFAYPVGAVVACGSVNLAVDGSSTTQVFSLRAADPTGSIPVTVHITRIIIECITTSATSLDKFGNLTALSRGLVMRTTGTEYHNVLNFKTGGSIAGTGYDYDAYKASSPEQNVDGFVARITWAGPGKMGTVIEVGPNQDIEFLVQDAMQTITSLKIMFEGHISAQ